jgi:sulfur relay (sulfurtransferase) complex TusBCD TusD component (DsrE family)
MNNFLTIETRDFIESRDSEWTGALAAELARHRADAAVFLTENGVLAARAAYDAPMLRQLMKKGVRIFADRFALAERGIADRDLAKGIQPADISLIAGVNVLWR